MRIQRHDRPKAFLKAASALLEAREAEHGLVVGVVRTCIQDPHRYPGANYFATAHDGDTVVGVAVMTPPHRLQVFVPVGAAVDALLDDVADHGAPVAGAHGPEASARAFSRAWCARYGGEARTHLRLRLFSLTEVTPAPVVPGAMRTADERDIGIVASWYERFFTETGAHTGGMEAAVLGERAVRQGRVFLWQDEDEIVTQAQVALASPRGARIGGVYTPPEQRRRGFATALVGALSQHVLDTGRDWCSLYTDLANPVSNSIYPKVGYRPVEDFVDIDIVGGDAGSAR